ncbi:unnamed protein product [Adineta ricciae]|uniref:Uncharacterized protein n=2 Tax=Adineta ricciae TaxID=249248 RepID=A0A813NZX2_ADIRI|nr:unnamed protein product [Adineta ricciae]
MGIGSSRKWSLHHGEKPSFGAQRSPSEEKHRGSFFRRRRSIPTASTTLPTMVQPISRRALYGSYSGMRPIAPAYSPMQPMSPSFLPMRYNNYSSPSYAQPQPMMMQAQRAAPAMPASYMALPSPSMSTPYIQPAQVPIQQAPVQPAYSTVPVQPQIPGSMSGGTGSYPLSYPSQPGRLLTDWTGGGKISPGFLGPPI